MKRSKLFLICSLVSPVLLFTVTSCKKSNDSNNIISSGQMSATINGTNFQSTYVVGIDKSPALNIAGVRIVSGDTTILQLTMADNFTLNNPLSFRDVTVMYGHPNHIYNGYYPPSHGAVSVDAWDKNALSMKGHFSGVLYGGNDSIVITDGSFTVLYAKQ